MDNLPLYNWFWGIEKDEAKKKETPVEKPPRKLIKAKDLPLYPDELPLSQYRFVEDEPLRFQDDMRDMRVGLQQKYRSFTNKYNSAEAFVNKTTKYAQFVREEGYHLPKAAAITVGGMAGFLIGMKRGQVPARVFYTMTGIGTMAAFCYPHETMDIARTSARYMNNQWNEFSKSPETASSEAKDLSKHAPAVTESKDIDLYTTRSKRID